MFSECKGLPQPEVVWSTSYINRQGYTRPEYKVEGIFTDGAKYWLAKDHYTGHGFTIKLSACKMNVVGIRVKNIAHDNGLSLTRATRSFRVSGVLKDSGPWEQLLDEEFDNPLPDGAPAPTLQTFYFREAVEVQFLRFDLDSYWNISGGLDYFAVITVSGNLCLHLIQLLQTDLCGSDCLPHYCGSPAPVWKPDGVNCQCNQKCTGESKIEV